MRYRMSRRGFTLIELIVALAIIGILIALLLPAIQAAREAARRAQCTNNLKQLALSMLNYEATFAKLPASSNHKTLTATVPAPGSSGPDGKGAGFSWLVSMLPYLEQAPLYDKIDFNKGPYGENIDKTVASTRIAIFNCPSYAGPQFSGAPEYPAGSQAISNYVCFGASHVKSLYRTETKPIGGKKHPNGLMYPGSWTPIRDVRDGMSNTLFAAETREENYAAWIDGTTAAVVALAEQTSPKFDQEVVNGDKFYRPKAGVAASLNYGDPKASPPTAYLPAVDHSGKANWFFGPSSRHPGIANHGFADGSVRAISDTIDPVVYMGLATRAGGEVLNADF